MRDSRYARHEPSHTQRLSCGSCAGGPPTSSARRASGSSSARAAGLERTYWDVRSCGKWSMHRVEHRPGSAAREG